MLILAGALIVGLTLGLLGSGGSAITVPILVYVAGHATKQSIAESLAIVGLLSVFAAVPYARSQQIDWRNVWFFGLPGMLGTLAGAWLGGLVSEAMQLFVFALVLLSAAWLMLRPPFRAGKSDASPAKQRSDARPGNHSWWKIAIEGTAVGIVTGFVGVGGGFLIVPALVLLGHLPMRLAIGTSLVIISLKSAIGFAKYQHYLLAHDSTVDLSTVAIFVLVGVIGSLVGKTMNAQLDQRHLKRLFAAFLLLLGGLLLLTEGRKLYSVQTSRMPKEQLDATQVLL